MELRVQHPLLGHQLLDYHLPLIYLLSHHLLDVAVLLAQDSQSHSLVLHLPL